MLNKFLDDKKSELYFVFRIIVGLMFALHGAVKLGLMGDPAAEGLYLVAGIIELVGGLAIVLGTYVGYAAVIAGLEMIYALVTVHFFSERGFNPLENGGEVALLYLAAFLVLAIHGAGKWSVGNSGKKK